MYPISPVYPFKTKVELSEVIYAKDQPQYNPLPVIKWKDGTVVSRWKLSWKERFNCLFTGQIFLAVMTFNSPLQPVLLSTDFIEETEKINVD